MDLDSKFTEWKAATGSLPWGAKRAFREVLSLTAEGKVTTLVYSADYNGGGACLVNSVGQMLTTHVGVGEGGGGGIPTANFREVVGLFDAINAELYKRGVNTDRRKVSALSAEILLHHFADVSDVPEFDTTVAAPTERYIEPSDDALMQDWLAAMESEPVTDTPKVDERA